MNYSSMEPLLFKTVHNIKLSCSVFRVTTFLPVWFHQNAWNTLPIYGQELDANVKTLYSKLVNNNNNDHKSYDANQWNSSPSALLTTCSDEISHCKH